MKKLYALMAAMMFVSFSFAQVAPISKSGNSMDLKKKPVANTPLKGMNSKGEAGSTWVYYPERVSNYWGVDCPMRSYILAPDSNGLIFPSSSAPSYPANVVDTLVVGIVEGFT